MPTRDDPSKLCLRVDSIEQLTPEIKRFNLSSEAGDLLPSFEAGAHIEVMVAGTMPRCYSLLNDCSERHRYSIAVLRERDGTGGSAFMHDRLGEGDSLTSSLPRNTFPLNESARQHLFVAGGIGITPILSMVQRAHRLQAQFTLHYCTRDTALTAFRDELLSQHSNAVTFYHDGGDPTLGLDLPRLLAQRPAETDLYVCGPRAMIDAARAAAHGWPEGAVHFELFSAGRDSAPVVAAGQDQSFVVELARSGVTFVIPPGKSILSVLTENGFKVPSVCKEGWCGTCRTRVLAGKVDHRDDYLEEEVRAANAAMQICVSRAATGERLLLDL